MRHSIWFIHSGIGRPVNTEGFPPERPDPAEQPRPVRASTRLWVRSMLAFIAMLLTLAAIIELVAVLVNGESESMPFGIAGACVAVAIVCTLAVTRGGSGRRH
ncbi:hypothetical protein ACFSWE_15170 [Leucobacter albus]|uniref:DUF202 domain-containing protein n=1 Tax=Leucobacter albus TaxID=272210 RepID=A0ABW3TMU6_9MICO